MKVNPIADTLEFFDKPRVKTEIPVIREEIQATYLRWTTQGRECESLKQGCSFCSMAQYGFSRHEVGVKKCWQPEANEQLKEKERKLAEGKPIKLVRKHEKKWS